MDQKPTLYCIESVDPQSLASSELIYVDPRSQGILQYKNDQLYYNQEDQTNPHYQQTKSPKPPKLRIKSIYNNSPKSNQSPIQQQEIMNIPQPSVTQNTGYTPQRLKSAWSQQQSTSQTITPEMISSDMNYESSTDNSVQIIPSTPTFELISANNIGAAGLNFITVLTPNGPVLIPATPEMTDLNSKQVITVVDNSPTNVSNQMVVNSNAAIDNEIKNQKSVTNRRRKTQKTVITENQQNTTAIQSSVDINNQIIMPVETVSGQILNSINSGTLVYTPDGPVYMINQEQMNGLEGLSVNSVEAIGHQQAEVIPQKGTVIEEPPKVQPVYSKTNGMNSMKHKNYRSAQLAPAAPVPEIDELDLDAALTVFKIYK